MLLRKRCTCFFLGRSTRATTEVHRFFFSEAVLLNLGAHYLSQKLIWGENKTATGPDEGSHGLGTRRESFIAKKNVTYFRRFWVKNPRHSETTSDEKRYLYRSTRGSSYHAFQTKATVGETTPTFTAVKYIGGETECPLQVCKLSRSSESTHFLFLRRDVALLDSTRAPDSF